MRLAAACVATAIPAEAEGFYIPPVVAMRPMTPAEEAANRAWNLRAALNVAALQCQFSPFLRSVANYNDMLRHHAAELEKAYKVIAAHFARYDGKAAKAALDQYTTRTYSSYSTLDAQLSFCDTASIAGNAALAAPKGGFGAVADRELPLIRASLSPRADFRFRPSTELAPVPLPVIDPTCVNKKGKVAKRCLK